MRDILPVQVKQTAELEQVSVSAAQQQYPIRAVTGSGADAITELQRAFNQTAGYVISAPIPP